MHNAQVLQQFSRDEASDHTSIFCSEQLFQYRLGAEDTLMPPTKFGFMPKCLHLTKIVPYFDTDILYFHFWQDYGSHVLIFGSVRANTT